VSSERGSRRAIVTGGAQGIGAAIVRRLAADGTRIAILDRQVDAARDVAAPFDGVAVAVDLAEPADVARACARAADLLGGCDVLVNDAGVFVKAAIVDTTAALFDDVMAVNARAVMLTMGHLAPPLQQSGRGAVINIASMAAKKGTTGEAAYAASKAAVVALTRIAALEFGAAGVTVNAVCPGYVLTEMGAATRTDADVAAWSAGSPLGRCTTPEEVADLVAFLASDAARGMTGQAINITAGMVTW
jgi:NAD(P)-dependent dehydrogenase (short-subunit alcohol dehydrogenase family)